MSYPNLLVRLLGVCALPLAALAQENAGEVGIHYAYNSLDSTNENGASVYGEYFFKAAFRTSTRKTRSVWSATSADRAVAAAASIRICLELASTPNGASRIWFFMPSTKSGGAHVRVNGANAEGANVSFARNSFALGIVGVGLDLRVGQRCVITLLQSDFPALEVPDIPSGVSHWSGDLRVSGGVGFRFGGRP